MEQSGDQKLYEALKKLEDNSSPGVVKFLRWIQNPKARIYRIPLGIALIILGAAGGVLPLIGVWMIPIGLVILAFDIPFLKEPIGKFILWAFEKWRQLKKTKAKSS